MSIEHKDVTVLILCGGAGTRMGGQDKPLQNWRGRAMVDWVLDTFPNAMPKLISANRNLDQYEQRAEVIRDNPEHPPGPLVGVLSGLSSMTTPWCLICPGDTPALPQDWFAPLLENLTPAVVAHDGERQQHLHMRLHKDCAASLAAYLSAGNHQVYRWLDDIKAQAIACADARAFHNMNRPEDLLTPLKPPG